MFPAVPGTPRRKKSGAAQESAFPPRPDSADIADFAFSSRPGTKEGDRSRPGTSGSFGTDLDSEYEETSRPGTNEGYRDRLTSAGFSRPGTSGSLATVNSEFDDFRPGQLHDDFKNMFHHMLKTSQIIFRIYTMYNPLKIFSRLWIFFAILGSLGIVRFLYFFYLNPQNTGKIQSLILSWVLIIAAIQYFALWVIGDLIWKNRKLIEDNLYLNKKKYYNKK